MLENVLQYRLHRQMARGGMADLYLASKEGPGDFSKTVVLKRVTKTLLHEEDARAMFLDEARLHSLLHHPHIVQLFDLVEDSSAYYMVLEYVPGLNLHQLITRLEQCDQLTRAQLILPIFCDVLSGLHFAHTLTTDEGHPLGIIHRDLSPGNILISRSGAAKLCDFGLAKSTLQRSLTQAGFTKGKFRYMAPEQLEGALTDHRADIFAVGACLYESITGIKLFPQDSDREIIRASRAGRYKFSLSLPKEIAAPLQEILAHALALQPEDRFSSAMDLHRACDALISKITLLRGPLFFGDHFNSDQPFLQHNLLNTEKESKPLSRSIFKRWMTR